MGFWAALEFLTVIPSPFRQKAVGEGMERSLSYFPLVGALLGGILLGLDWLLRLVFPLPLVDILLIVALAVLSGGLHLDGFIDTFDGVVLHRPVEERLRVLSDSRIGGFGVVAACCLFLVKFAALLVLPLGLRAPVLVLMPLLSRWGMACQVFAFPYAKESGLGSVFKKGATWPRLAVATVVALAVSLALLRVQGLALMAGLWLLSTGLAYYFHRRLGGLTGDTYGAVNEAAEVMVLLLLPLIAGGYGV